MKGSFIDYDDMKRTYTFIEKKPEDFNFFNINSIQELYEYVLEYGEDDKSENEEEEISERLFYERNDKILVTNHACNETYFFNEENNESLNDSLPYDLSVLDKENKKFLERIYSLSKKSSDRSSIGRVNSEESAKSMDSSEIRKNSDDNDIQKSILENNKMENIIIQDNFVKGKGKYTENLTIKINKLHEGERILEDEKESPYFKE
ncbi:hypothetical protein SteCoe_7032 [Stentor coeruleus]|uniref:Uncharacterized protein n=1 Tax=Stentor coeruleus TaxID=5963 RepID=A0A1R2CNI2_9CILI|nr:hypothetical protein SteCoe_7032 [Stentor coeruleus]